MAGLCIHNTGAAGTLAFGLLLTVYTVEVWNSNSSLASQTLQQNINSQYAGGTADHDTGRPVARASI